MKWPNRRLPWSVNWREPETKKQRWKYFVTKREAEAFRDTVNTELRQGTYIDRRPIPFKTFATDWLARTQPTVSANTHALHQWAVDRYLVPAFNLMAVQSLKPDRIERWQADLLHKGKPGPRSVQIIRGVLNTILEDARAKGYIFVNPMGNVRRFDVPERADTAHRERRDRSIVNTPIAHRERSVATRDRLLSARASPPFVVRALLA